MVRLGEVEAEQVEHAHDDVELARDAQVEQVTATRVEHRLRRGGTSAGAIDEPVVDHPVEHELDRAAEHHRQAGLLDRVQVRGA